MESAHPSVAAINEYAARHHDSALECVEVAMKGRTLVARKAYAAGDLILVERPLHIVQEDPGTEAFETLSELCEQGDFDYDPLWYWAALNSLTAGQLAAGGEWTPSWEPLDGEKQQRLLLLHQGDVEEASEGVEAIARKLAPGLDNTITLERLLQAWVHNAFD